QLALIACLGAGDAARHDLAGFGNVGTKGFEVLVVDGLDAFCGESAVLATAEEARHVESPVSLTWSICPGRSVVAAVVVGVVAVVGIVLAFVFGTRALHGTGL